MITLDQVRSFVAVAEELHFGRAAERLQMTQPPLSRQIQKLEKSVGARLLERDNRRVELTGAGVAFLDEAHRLLNLVEGAGVLGKCVVLTHEIATDQLVKKAVGEIVQKIGDLLRA